MSIYLIAVLLPALWLSPAIYQGIRALADVSHGRVSHGAMRSMADWTGRVSYHEVFVITLAVFALALLLPLYEATAGNFFRSIRLGDGEGNLRKGMACFVVPACGGLLGMAAVMILEGGRGIGEVRFFPVLGAVFSALAIALAFECVLRGAVWNALDQCLAGRWTLLVVSSSLFVAMRVLLLPMTGDFTFACDESWALGWQMVAMLTGRLLDPTMFLTVVVPVFGWGILLGMVRERCGGVWLPFCLHAGWLCVERVHVTIVASAWPGALLICWSALIGATCVFAFMKSVRFDHSPKR